MGGGALSDTLFKHQLWATVSGLWKIPLCVNGANDVEQNGAENSQGQSGELTLFQIVEKRDFPRLIASKRDFEYGGAEECPVTIYCR